MIGKSMVNTTRNFYMIIILNFLKKIIFEFINIIRRKLAIFDACESYSDQETTCESLISAGESPTSFAFDSQIFAKCNLPELITFTIKT